MEDKYKKWDAFIYQMILCVASAQKKYKYFMVMAPDPKEPYDLFFHHIAIYANQLVKECKVSCYSSNIFKFITFKLKERQARYPRYKERRMVNSAQTHLCSALERADLIEEMAKKNDIDPKDIVTIYKEYYSR